MSLRDLIELFLDGNDDKIYIDIYDGNEFDELFHDVRIISSLLVPYYDRKVIALLDGTHCTTLGVILGNGGL